jgi:hypothetical protein
MLTSRLGHAALLNHGNDDLGVRGWCAQSLCPHQSEPVGEMPANDAREDE